MSLYNLRLLAPNHYAMAKFDADFNVEAVYNLEPKGSGYTCDCPANNRSVVLKPCKHKRMIPLMLGAVNTDRFYDPETRSWCQPLAPTSAEAMDVAAFEAEGRQGSEQVQEPHIMTEAEVLKAYEPVQRAAEAVIEPVLNRTLELAQALDLIQPSDLEPPHEQQSMLPPALALPKPQAAPTIRRR